MHQFPKNGYPSLIDWIELPKIRKLLKYLMPSKWKLENRIENPSENYNYYIGDNLRGMLSLISDYAESFQLAFIDPPYNSSKDYIQNDFPNEKVPFWTAGTSHRKWMRMMFPRVIYIWQLLHPDNGMIFFSIDDKELIFAKLLLDAIFGEYNFIGTYIWQSYKERKINALFTVNHTYILVYAKNRQYFIQNLRSISGKENYFNQSSIWTDLPSSTEARDKLFQNFNEEISLNTIRFLNPKPGELLSRILEMVFTLNKCQHNCRVLDPFAGTGSLLYAVHDFNKWFSINLSYFGFQFPVDISALASQNVKEHIKKLINADTTAPLIIPDITKLRNYHRKNKVSIQYYHERIDQT